MSNIHPTAVVHPTAVIGEDVEIGANTVVGAYSVIECATIGANCKISPGAFIGGPPQDFKYDVSQKTRLILGDGCVVRECVTLNRGTMSDGGTGVTKIGNNCFFMAYSHVGHDCEVGNNVILTNNVSLGGHVIVGDYAVFGGIAGVHQFVRVGAMVMVGGMSGVDRDIAPYCMAQGERINLIGLNSVGLRRRGLARETISQIKNAYKTIFLGQKLLKEAVAEVEAQGNVSPELAMFLNFLKAPSKRGITRARMTSGEESE